MYSCPGHTQLSSKGAIYPDQNMNSEPLALCVQYTKFKQVYGKKLGSLLSIPWWDLRPGYPI